MRVLWSHRGAKRADYFFEAAMSVVGSFSECLPHCRDKFHQVLCAFYTVMHDFFSLENNAKKKQKKNHHLPRVLACTCLCLLWFMVPAGRENRSGKTQPTFDYELFPSIALTQTGMHWKIYEVFPSKVISTVQKNVPLIPTKWLLS